MAVNDKNGNTIEIGSEVIVRCKVIALQENMVRLKTVEGTERYPDGVEFGLDRTQVEAIGAKEQADIKALNGQPANADNVAKVLPRNQPIYQRPKA